MRAVLEEACAFFRAAAALADGEPSGGGGGGGGRSVHRAIRHSAATAAAPRPRAATPPSPTMALHTELGGRRGEAAAQLRADLHATITKLSARAHGGGGAAGGGGGGGVEAQPMDDESPGAAGAAAAWAATSGEAAASPVLQWTSAMNGAVSDNGRPVAVADDGSGGGGSSVAARETDGPAAAVASSVVAAGVVETALELTGETVPQIALVPADRCTIGGATDDAHALVRALAAGSRARRLLLPRAGGRRRAAAAVGARREGLCRLRHEASIHRRRGGVHRGRRRQRLHGDWQHVGPHACPPRRRRCRHGRPASLHRERAAQSRLRGGGGAGEGSRSASRHPDDGGASAGDVDGAPPQRDGADDWRVHPAEHGPLDRRRRTRHLPAAERSHVRRRHCRRRLRHTRAHRRGTRPR